MIPKVRMFYGRLSTDFSTSGVENVSKKLQGEEIGRGLTRMHADQNRQYQTFKRLRSLAKDAIAISDPRASAFIRGKIFYPDQWYQC